MQNKRALFLIEQSNLADNDKQFLITHMQVYEDMLNTVESELSMRKLQLDSIKKDLVTFSESRKKLLLEFEAISTALGSAKQILSELQKVQSELKEINETLDSSAKQSLAKSNEQIYYLEYKLRKAVELINMIDFPAIRQTV